MMLRAISVALVILISVSVSIAQEKKEREDHGQTDHVDLLYLAEPCPVFVRLHIRVDGQSYHDVWQDYVEQYFDELDEDDDNVLSLAEAKNLPASTATPNTTFGRVRAFFKSLGSNGKAGPLRSEDMSKADVSRYLQQLGQGPFSLNVVRRTSSFGGLSAENGPTGLFERIDTDRSGRISRAELQSAASSLHKNDLDDDQMISAEELQSVNAFSTFMAMRTERVKNATSPVLRLKTGEMAEQAVAQLLKNYDGENAETRKPDRHLSRDEIQLSRSIFQEFDTDSDSLLDESELEHLAGNLVPTLEFTVRIGKRAEHESSFTLESSNASEAISVRKMPNGAPAVVLKAEQIVFSADGGAGGAEGIKALAKQQFAAVDTDNNGYLDWKETARNSGLTSTFRDADRDGDKKVFQDEFLDYLERRYNVSRSRTALNISGPHRKLFEILDTDSDRRLSQRELAAAVDQFDVWDSNGDKQLASSELPRQYRLSVGRATPDLGALGNLAAIQFAYAPAAQPPRKSTGPIWFQRMDHNRDGDLSRREFLFKADWFNRLDADKNGLVDPKEALSLKSESDDR